ncbi:MAG: pyridoxamine 5'-phosphate oxidase family protein [Minwuia sp.]|nr:pyridoxamine 5'-phosphate oxidase family protein [Minwuia sp.]
MARETKAPTERTRVKRVNQRAVYDREGIDAILDAQPLCHIGYLRDGHPFVTPTFQWREGDRVYFHGSAASQALRAATGTDICLTVSCLDGYVLARSGFHHSVNYRSVMILGKAEIVTDTDEKNTLVNNFVEGLFPGRVATLRPNNAQELKATTVLSLPISEASAKVRNGGPVDDDEDYELPIWAGVIPLRTVMDEPYDDGRVLDGVEVPDHVRNFNKF